MAPALARLSLHRRTAAPDAHAEALRPRPAGTPELAQRRQRDTLDRLVCADAVATGGMSFGTRRGRGPRGARGARPRRRAASADPLPQWGGQADGGARASLARRGQRAL